MLQFVYFLVFDEGGVNLDEPYIASCGSGVSACWLAVAAFVCGKDLPVFDVRCAVNYNYHALVDFCDSCILYFRDPGLNGIKEVQQIVKQ